MKEMKIEYIPLDKIKPYENNPRINDEAVKYVANSIKEFGFKVPIIIDENNVIVAGHTRLKAAKKLGFEKVPCIRADDLTENQIKAFRLADNKVGEIATWDFNSLAVELANIENINMSNFNFEPLDVSPDDFGNSFILPDGEKPEICTMTFTVHEKQKELIEYAINLVKDEVVETFGNSNKNGNALYEVVKQWAELKK
jgi:Predicted transcriptional regulators